MSLNNPCRYGDKCYRKAPNHFEEFSHPHLNTILTKLNGEEISIPTGTTFHVSQQTLKEQLQIVRNLQPSSSTDEASSTTSSADSSTSSKRKLNTETRDQDEAKIRKKVENTNNPSQNIESSVTVSAPSTQPSNEKLMNHFRAMGYRVACVDRLKNNVTDKLIAAAPYNYFLTTVTESAQTQVDKLSITLAELLDPHLGDLVESLQMNFVVELGWLLAQYHVMGHRRKPLTLLYSDLDEAIDPRLDFITHKQVKPPSHFGSHHTKMMVMAYKDNSIRVIVSTANLVESDWDNRTQGVWVSPACPRLPPGSDSAAGESPTMFKSNLISYFAAYRLPEMEKWIDRLKNADFSQINVVFVASIPGTHRDSKWGLRSLASKLAQYTVSPNTECSVIAQCSSIGTMGATPETFFRGEFLEAFASCKNPGHFKKDIRLIYPCFKDVESSYDGLLGGTCLPYPRQTHDKQQWLTSFMCKWRSDSRHRTRAVPHIKTYSRFSDGGYTNLDYHLLTSANSSKAAWGWKTPSGALNILSYEAGVLFLPQFITGKSKFSIGPTCGGDQPPFPFPYDLPPTPYSFSDVPFFFDVL